VGRWLVLVHLVGCAGEPGVGWLVVGRVDEHDDGSQDVTWHRRVDDELRVIWEEWFSPLVRAVPAGRTEYVYDADGLVIEETYDLYGDGILDRWSVWTRDERGRPLLEERLDPEGRPITVVTYDYVDDRLVGVDLDARGADDDDDVATLSYDGGGRLLRVEHDQGRDGTIDRREEYAYERAAPSLDGDYRLDTDGDGRWELDRKERFDAHGRLVRSEGWEYTGNMVREVTFDAEGRMIESRATGSRAEDLSIWRYDPLGHLREETTSHQVLVPGFGSDDRSRTLWDWEAAERTR
jgi:hypothetical protein